MGKKKIWFILGCLFLAVCLSLVFQTMSEKTELKPANADNTEYTAYTAKVTGEDTMHNKENIHDFSKAEEEASYENTGDTLNEKDNDTEKLKQKTSNVEVDKEKELKCTLSVTCATILNNVDKLNKEKADIVPEDGVIYPVQEVVFYDEETVFDVLLREMKKNKIHMEYSMTPLYNSNYIEGIGNIYELDCGGLSGWIYKVNGVSPNYGCSRYGIKDGDIVEWQYTCDLGRDVGAESMNMESGEQQ